MLPVSLVIDFDSTFIELEGLEELLQRALDGTEGQEAVMEQCRQLTAQAMEGQLPFEQALEQRVALLEGLHIDLDSFVTYLNKHITPSIRWNRRFIREHSESIYIVSGGFIEYIWPIVAPFGIPRSHVFANSLYYNYEGSVAGYDKNNPLARAGGKAEVVAALPNSAIVLGDGHTDWEVVEAGKAEKFYYFAENVLRKEVADRAYAVVEDFDHFLQEAGLRQEKEEEEERPKALLLENIHERAVAALESRGYVVTLKSSSLSEEELISALEGVSLLGVRSKTQVTERVLQEALSLEAVGTFCIGTKQVDLEAAAQRGIAVFNAPYSNTRSVVELAMAAVVLLLRKVVLKNALMHQGIWDKGLDGASEVRGKTLGIVGYGSIGAQLSVLAEAFGMEVIYYDFLDRLPMGNAQACSLEEVLARSHAVSLHVDDRAENHGWFNKERIGLMRRGAVLLNLSRGFVIQEDDLFEALQSKFLGGACIDVFPKEPKGRRDSFESKLKGLDNVLLTPHIGGNTREAQEDIARFVTKQLLGYMRTGTTTTSVNFPQLQLPEIAGAHRLIHIHRNLPGVAAAISSALARYQLNIVGQYLQTNNAIGYVITDVHGDYDHQLFKDLEGIDHTIHVRVVY